MKPTDRPDPAAFPLGSPESRAAARLKAEESQEMARTIFTDLDGNPIWDVSAVYGLRSMTHGICPAPLSREEWVEECKYLRPEKDPLVAARTAAEHQKRREAEEARDEAWKREFNLLIREHHGRVPGAVAARRIPPLDQTEAAKRQRIRLRDEDNSYAGVAARGGRRLERS